MKRSLALVAALGAALLFSPALHAGDLSRQGLADPVVTPPADVSGDWTGLYAGVSAERSSSSTEDQRCFKLGQPKDCNDPIFEVYPELKVIETFSVSSSSTEPGAFVGYRHDFGKIVGGIELSATEASEAAELQLGLDLNRVLVYGLAGSDGYGAGADVQLGKRLFLGAKYVKGDDSDRAVARFGIRF